MPDSTPSPSPAKSAFVVGVPREIHADERRVAVTPATVKALRKLNLDVLVEAGAGEAASYTDAQYAEAGARIAATAEETWRGASLVLKVRPPEARPEGGHEADLLEPGARLVGFIWPAQNQE